MVELALFIVCLLGASLKKTYRQLAVAPAEEGKRLSRNLHTTLKHVSFLNVLLDTIVFAALALFALSVAFSLSVIWAFLIIFVAFICIIVLLPRLRTDPISKKFAGLLASPLAYVINKFAGPITRLETSIARTNQRLHKTEPITKAALINLLKEQRDVSEGGLKIDLDLALAGLELHAQKVGHLMVRKPKAKIVSVDDEVGPVLLSELHDTGRKVFAAKNQDGELNGIIRLDNLAELKAGGHAGDALNPQMVIVNKSDPILGVIVRFVDESAELLFATDDTGEVVGVIYLEDVLKQLVED